MSGHALLVGKRVAGLALEGPGEELVGVVGLVVCREDSEALAVVGDLGLGGVSTRRREMREGKALTQSRLTF
jgi:hypothetical protein